MDLNDMRQQIDLVDKNLIALLEKRMDLVQNVLAYKKKTGMPIFDAGREASVLERVSKEISNKDYEQVVLSIFADMMAHSRNYQTEQLR